MSHSVATTGQMGCSFFSSLAAEAPVPHTLHSGLSAEQELSAEFGNARRNSPHMDTHTALSDDSREELIRMRGALIEHCMARAAHLPDWQAAIYRAEAQAHEERMRHLIAGRSAAKVRSLEIRRGLI